MPVNSDILLLQCSPGFSSLPSLQAVTSAVLWTVKRTPTAVLSLGLLSKPHFQAPKLPPYWEIHDSGWGMPDCGMKHTSYTVLPSTDWLISVFPSRLPEVSFLPQFISTVKRLFWVWEPRLTFNFPRRVLDPSCFLFFFFSVVWGFFLFF